LEETFQNEIDPFLGNSNTLSDSRELLLKNSSILKFSNPTTQGMTIYLISKLLFEVSGIQPWTALPIPRNKVFMSRYFNKYKITIVCIY